MGWKNHEKLAILLKASYRFNADQIKYTVSYIIHLNRKKIIKFTMEAQNAMDSQSNPEQKEFGWKHHHC